jgi:hypothetical protein
MQLIYNGDTGTRTGTDVGSWYQWNVKYVQTNSVTCNDVVWASWYADQGTGSQVVTSSCWQAWNVNYPVQTLVYTQEQIELARQRGAEREKQNKIALENAEALLFLCLTETQKSQYKEHGYFETVVDDRTFRITKGWSGNVHEYKDGKKIKSYCIHPNEDVPVPDNMLTQKLLLETQLDLFMRTANMTSHI